MPPVNNPIPPNQFPSYVQQPRVNPVVSDENTPNKNHKEEVKNIIYTVLLFVIAPICALIMIMFVFQSYVVDGSSMYPTLENGNRVFILKLPKSIANVRGKQFIPSRNEIIVFKKPSDPSVQLIKRVIGLPGDRVVVKDNRITVYNSQRPDGFNPDAGSNHDKIIDPTTGNVDVVVGAEELFVAGDNRKTGGSLDSRTGLGLVPVQNIIGRLWVRYYPLGEFKVFSYLTSVRLFYSSDLLLNN